MPKNHTAVFTMAEAEDLYDDLYEDDSLFYKAPFQEIDIREEEFKKKEAELNAKVESLQKEVEALQQDKVVLTRNISCLFKTAQMELARKDKQMKELRDENSKLKLGGRRNPGPPHSTNAAAAKTNSAIVDSAHQPEIERTNAAVDDSKQRSSSRPLENSSSTRAHERDSEGHRKIVGEERKDASRGSKDRSAEDSSNNRRSSSHNSDRRHAEYEHRSRDHSEHRSRDGELRSSDCRKRHRS